jgi:hypothetical protein
MRAFVKPSAEAIEAATRTKGEKVAMYRSTGEFKLDAYSKLHNRSDSFV